jgi:hypothetical protein
MKTQRRVSGNSETDHRKVKAANDVRAVLIQRVLSACVLVLAFLKNNVRRKSKGYT